MVISSLCTLTHLKCYLADRVKFALNGTPKTTNFNSVCTAGA